MIKILAILQTNQSDSGLDIDEITNQLGGSSINDVQSALGILQSQSVVYTDSDEKRYKVVVN